MENFIANNREQVVTLLTGEQYSMQAIEHAFAKVGRYSGLETVKGEQKRSQTILRRIVTKKSIYTHILKETLEYTMKEWDEGHIGRVAKKNLRIYRNVCSKLLRETLRLLGLEPQVEAHELAPPGVGPVQPHD